MTRRLARRGLLLGAGLLGAGLLGAGLAPIRRAAAASQAARRPVTFAAGAQISASCIDMMNAVAGPFCRDAGLDADLVGVTTGAAAISALVSGQSALIRCNALDVLHAAGVRNLPVVAIGASTAASGFLFVSAAARPVRDAASLRGARVGIFGGAGSETDLLLDLALRSHGISADAVERYRVAGSVGAYALIEQGRLDCIVEPATAASTLLESGKPVFVWNADAAAPLPGKCLVATRDRIDADPDLLTACLRAIRASMRDLLTPAGPATAIPRVAARFGVPTTREAPLFAARMRDEIAAWTVDADGPSLRNDPAAWRAGCNALAQLGLFKVPPAETIVTNAIVDRL